MPKRKREPKQKYDDIIKEAERYRKHFIRNNAPRSEAVERVSRVLDKAYGPQPDLNGGKVRKRKNKAMAWCYGHHQMRPGGGECYRCRNG